MSNTQNRIRRVDQRVVTVLPLARIVGGALDGMLAAMATLECGHSTPVEYRETPPEMARCPECEAKLRPRVVTVPPPARRRR